MCCSYFIRKVFGSEVNEVSVEYKSFVGANRDPLFYNSTPNNELNLNVNLTLNSYLFMDNQVHSMTNESQYYLVGWHYKLGAHITDDLDLYYEHFSQHILDNSYPYMSFPLENAIVIKYNLLKSDKERKSFFP